VCSFDRSQRAQQAGSPVCTHTCKLGNDPLHTPTNTKLQQPTATGSAQLTATSNRLRTNYAAERCTSPHTTGQGWPPRFITTPTHKTNSQLGRPPRIARQRSSGGQGKWQAGGLQGAAGASVRPACTASRSRRAWGPPRRAFTCNASCTAARLTALREAATRFPPGPTNHPASQSRPSAPRQAFNKWAVAPKSCAAPTCHTHFSAATCGARLKWGRVAQGIGRITRWGGAVLWRDSCHTHLALTPPKPSVSAKRSTSGPRKQGPHVEAGEATAGPAPPPARSYPAARPRPPTLGHLATTAVACRGRTRAQGLHGQDRHGRMSKGPPAHTCPTPRPTRRGGLHRAQRGATPRMNKWDTRPLNPPPSPPGDKESTGAERYKTTADNRRPSARIEENRSERGGW
jgi:hypothetical protein